jgi:tetratricopeptide (TPR) repeat protein
VRLAARNQAKPPFFPHFYQVWGARSMASEASSRHEGNQDTVDQQTRQALKRDKFVSTTQHGLDWATENREQVVKLGVIAAVVVAAVIIGAVVYHSRSQTAAAALGDAMQTYQTPLANPQQETPPGTKTFPSIAERAKAANAQFTAIADKYGMTAAGENAQYFAGLTYEDQGKNQQAEDALKKVAGSWNSRLASLGKFALAQLYRNTNRDSQAIDLYNQLSAKPTDTVPYGMSQLTLADLYNSEGKTDEAKKIYASLKDKDSKGPAGEIAAQKLNPAAAEGAPGLPQ